MRDRGYIIPQEFDKDTMTKEVFMLRYANNEEQNVERELLKMRFVHQTERHKILVMFEQNAKVGKKEVERLCERMGEDKRCVLILDGAVSSAARIQIESMNPTIVIEVSATEEKYSGGKDVFNFFFFFFSYWFWWFSSMRFGSFPRSLCPFFLQIFREEQLLVNITEHRLVPLHQPLTRVQKEAVLARYRVKESQLPRMELQDPIARYFGLARGDLVKITRSSETAGRYTTYRLVV